MRGKRRILLIALLVVVLGGIALFLLRPKGPLEPVYAEKGLVAWLIQYREDDLVRGVPRLGAREDKQRAEDAIIAIGTNGVPYLLGMLQEKDSAMKLRIIELVGKQRYFRPHLVPADYRNYLAATGFEVLGSNALPAVSRLIDILERNPNHSSREHAARALGGIGPAARDAIPALVEALGDNDRSVKVHAAEALGLIHGKPEVALPALINCLSSTDAYLRHVALAALGSFGTNAKPAIPALIKAANEMDEHYREPYRLLIRQIDPAALKDVKTGR